MKYLVNVKMLTCLNETIGVVDINHEISNFKCQMVDVVHKIAAQHQMLQRAKNIKIN